MILTGKESVPYRNNDAIPVRQIHQRISRDSLLAGFRIAAVDNDLALENLEDHWDMTLADRQDLERRL